MLEKLKAIYSAILNDAVDTYKRFKLLFIAVGAAILYLEWEKIKAALAVYAGKQEIKKDKKEDEVLAKKEQDANNQADALVKKSEKENSDNDWYKK